MSQADLFARELPTQEGERWTDVRGKEGEYAVSNHGRVLSYESGVMSPSSIREDEHKVVSVGKSGSTLVHRLVIKHHGPAAPTEQHDTVNHIDGDPTNNHIDNLEWVTQRENVCHGALKDMIERWGASTAARRIESWAPEVADKIKGTGEKGRPRALDEKDLACIVQLRKRGQTIADIARRFQVCRKTISKRLQEYVEENGIDLNGKADKQDARRRTFTL